MTIYEIMQDAMQAEVEAQVTNFDDDELMSLNNDYCQDNGYSDDEIFYNDEDFFNVYYEGRVYDAVKDTNGCDYKYTEDYVKFSIYGLESSDYVVNLLVDDIPTLAEWALENDFPFLDSDEVENAGHQALKDEIEVVMGEESNDIGLFLEFFEYCLDNEDDTLEYAWKIFKEEREEETVQETVENQLDTLGTLDRIALWNDYQNDIGDSEYIFDNNVETFASCEVFESQAEIWLTLKNSPDYKFNDYYMVFEDGRTLVSSNNIDDLIAWDTEKIAKWVIENEYWEYADYLTDPKELEV